MLEQHLPFFIRKEICPNISSFEDYCKRLSYGNAAKFDHANADHIVTISFFFMVKWYLMVSKMLLVCLEHVLGKALIFFSKVHCSGK